MKEGNPIVRVYRPVLNAYREIAKDYDIFLSDFISSVLLKAGVFYEDLITVVLMEGFGFDFKEAKEGAIKLSQKLEEELKKEWEKEEVEEAGVIA